MTTQLHEINGKLDLIQDLELKNLNLSLDQQNELLKIHQELIDERTETIKQIRKEYIL